MEPRVVMGRYSAEENVLEIWDTTQATQGLLPSGSCFVYLSPL